MRVRSLAPFPMRPLAPLALLVLALVPALAWAAPTGKVRGRISASNSTEPVGFADVALIPADTTLRRIGALSNADGTFLLEAPAGLYTLQIRALSYARKSIRGVSVDPSAMREVVVELMPEAIQQKVVEVEAEAKRNNETALLNERRKAATVGDAVSAELVRKSADSDAGEVLRRVTGLSVFQGRFVFVRGMGERYSSTEIDGVRIASPEQNKRVVPLDILPANLLENVVVQKTYSADRSGEFGGGDVQVHTREFPGARTFSIGSVSSYEEGTTSKSFMTYRGGWFDGVGYGLDYRAMPGIIGRLAGSKPLFKRGNFDPPGVGMSADTMAAIGKSFANVWSPYRRSRAPLGGGYSESYGDEWNLFGHALGLVQSATFSRSLNSVNGETQRLFTSGGVPVYDYRVSRATEVARLAGLVGLSLRLAPNHSLHYRGLYTRDAENEARSYEGMNASLQTMVRAQRLMYVERTIVSNSIEGRHQLRSWIEPRVEWKLSRSSATRSEPDRRETIYQQNSYFDDAGNSHSYYAMSGAGLGASRYFGDLLDRGHGLEGKVSVPIPFLGGHRGRVELGGSHQVKDRESLYRRFLFKPGTGIDMSAPPESLFRDARWNGLPGGATLVEATRADDNYSARQRFTAGYLSMDVPFDGRVRAVAGLRVERGDQDVRTYDLFHPDDVVAAARLHDTDLLPALNVTVALTARLNLRVGASRTLSRPDLRELTPGPTADFLNGLRVAGNPGLERSKIDNYDLRLELFPALAEVLAIGGFVKELHAPVENVIVPGDAPLIRPENSRRGRVHGVELEARSSMQRFGKALAGVSVNSNLSLISSEVTLRERTTSLGTRKHPLQGQSDVLWNGAVTYSTPSGHNDVSVMVNVVGKRLEALGVTPQPDRYEQRHVTLDAALNLTPLPWLCVKLTGKNLNDQPYRVLDGADESRRYKSGRGVSLGVTLNH